MSEKLYPQEAMEEMKAAIIELEDRLEQANNYRRFQAATAAMREDIGRGNVGSGANAQARAPYWVACADALLAALDGKAGEP